MTHNDTGDRAFHLPVAQDTPRARLQIVRLAPSVDFISQLIAERDHLPPQRERRRAPVGVALGAYDAGSKIAVRRMPAGYRTTIVT